LFPFTGVTLPPSEELMTQEPPQYNEPRGITSAHLVRWPRRMALAIGTIAVIASAGAVYLATADAVRIDTLSLIAKGGLTLDGSAGPDGERFTSLGLKNVMPVPITLLGMEPVGTPSDWRVVEMRIGAPTPRDHSVAEVTEPFTPQRIGPGGTLAVVIMYQSVPCDSPRLADGTLSGPIDFRIRYSILGIHRTLTFLQEGASATPASELGCPAP
jgi:hypothetical protein